MWLSRIRSFLVQLRASGRYGRALKLERQGATRDALRVARASLVTLRESEALSTCRDEDFSTALVVMQVEHLANKLGEPGATLDDLKVALSQLESTPHKALDAKTARYCSDGVEYLRSRLSSTENMD